MKPKKVLGQSIVIMAVVMTCLSLEVYASVERTVSNRSFRATLLMLSDVKTNTPIPYRVAKHYFAKNNVNHSEYKKIDNQTEFDNLFGSATTMHETPTKINFSKQSILALVGKETAYDTELIPESVIKLSNGDVQVSYRKKVSKVKQTSTSIPVLLLVVDKTEKILGKMTIHQIK